MRTKAGRILIMLGILIFACALALILTSCTPDEVYQQRGTMTAAVATATREAQYAQATATVVEMQRQGTQAAADAAEAETRLLLARATQTVIAAQTAQAVQATRSAVETASYQATRQAADRATQQAYMREGWTATVHAGEREATATAAQRTYEAEQTYAAVSATWTAQAYVLQQTATVAQIMADATSQAAGAGIIAEQYEQERILTQQADYGKFAWVIVAVIAALAGVALVSYTLFNVARTKAVTQIVPRGALGEAPVVLINNRALMPDRSMYPVADPRKPVLPPVEAQLRLAQSDAVVQGLRAAGHAPAAKMLKPEEPGQTLAEGAEEINLPLSADWRLFVQHQGPELPLGVAPDGSLMLAHPEQYPHFTVAGMSGGGKTRYGVKPKVAAALARGWYVATLGDMAPVGMHAFAGFPNYQDVVVENPIEVLAFLERLDQEIRLRMDALYQHKAGRWEEMLRYGPRVLVVIDEFAAVADDLEGQYRTRYMRVVTNICRLARKTGIHLILGVQNPTAESIRPSTRRNTLTQVFHVTDAAASRAILTADGAERLQGGQYLAIFQEGTLAAGAAFDPSDEQLEAYLGEKRGRVTVCEQPRFLQRLPEQISLPEPEQRTTTSERMETLRRQAEEQRVAAMAEQVRELWEGGANRSDLARALNLGTGGSDWAKVQAVVTYLEHSSSSPAMAGGE